MKKNFVLNAFLKRIPRLRICFIIIGILLGLHLNAAKEEAASMQAGKKIVSGVITDAINGEALPGVSVLVKGTTTGTITDLDGTYSINVSDQDVLIFSYVGYLNEEVAVGSQTVINFNLTTDIIGLDEVVVIGYGVQPKKLLTGATVHVKDAEIAKMHSVRLEQAMQGLTPGVQVTSNSGQPGEGLKVRVRGVGTIGNADPLYIIDGVPTDDIRFLSPSDVESIDILKDAASSAIYGARAANGVVLITTKKGQSGAMRVSYDGYYGIQNTPKTLDMLNAEEYMTIMNEAAANSGNKTIFTQQRIDTAGEGTNWMDYLFNEDVPTQSHALTLSGGTEKSVYSTSLSYINQGGIIGSEGKSQYERISIKINAENKLYKERLKVGENLVYSVSNTRGVGVGDKYNSAVRRYANATPVYSPYDPAREDGFSRSPVSVDEANPVAQSYYLDLTKKKTDELIGKIYAELEILKGLRFNISYSIDLDIREENTYKPIYQLTSTNFNEFSYALQKMGRDFKYDFENYWSYTRSFGAHNFVLLAGHTVEEFNMFEVSGEKENLIIDDFDHAILDNATRQETVKTNGNKLVRRLLSHYFRLNYNYGEKYLLSASLRRDGSTKFGPENRFGNFPSVSAGFVFPKDKSIVDEVVGIVTTGIGPYFLIDYLQNIDVIDFFKVRASWGQNGNDKIGDFRYEATIQSTERDYYFGVDDVQFIGSSPERIHNPKLKWETAEQIDIGFDSRFLNAFSLVFDWYNRVTKDWLIEAPVADIAGNQAPMANGGDVRNRGVEVALGYRKYKGDFTFGVNANIAYNKNEVLKINNNDGIIHGEENILFHGHDEVYRTQVGYPIGYFYGYKTDGIFQDTIEIQNYSIDGVLIQPLARPGDVRFQDINNDGVINVDDRTMIGNPYPDLTYGFSFDAEYKGFDFSILLQGVHGNEILYGIRINERAFYNYPSDIMDRWHGYGTSNTVPRVTQGNEPNQNYKRVSDLSIYDGSYLKIRSINIGYDLKKGIKKLPLQKCRLYYSALNLFTFTKYPGLDPEVGYGSYDATRYANYSSGIDIGYYPTPITHLIGLNVTF